MLGELINIPTEILIDMISIIFASERVIGSSVAAELEQIQRELQRRGVIERWACRTVNQIAGMDNMLVSG